MLCASSTLFHCLQPSTISCPWRTLSPHVSSLMQLSPLFIVVCHCWLPLILIAHPRFTLFVRLSWCAARCLLRAIWSWAIWSNTLLCTCKGMEVIQLAWKLTCESVWLSTAMLKPRPMNDWALQRTTRTKLTFANYWCPMIYCLLNAWTIWYLHDICSDG